MFRYTLSMKSQKKADMSVNVGDVGEIVGEKPGNDRDIKRKERL